MLRLETCMETWAFEQSSCWKYYTLVGEICRHRIKCVLHKKHSSALTPTARGFIWHCGLPVLDGSCTGIISERHPSLGAKQVTGLTTKLKDVTAVVQHIIIV